jgi:hypothetical protein
MISDEPINDVNDMEDIPVRQEKQEETDALKEDKQPTKLKIKARKLKLVDNE